jgi:hypothetical protein
MGVLNCQVGSGKKEGGAHAIVKVNVLSDQILK